MSEPRVSAVAQPGALLSGVKTKSDLLLIGAFALAVNCFRVGRKSIWRDESISAEYTMQGIRGVAQRVLSSDPNSVLFYQLLTVWARIFGRSESSLRMMSVLCVIGAVCTLYLVGVRLFNRQTGVLAALLLASNVFVVTYGQTARGYALLLLLTTVSTLLFVVEFETPSRKTRVAYVLAGTPSMYTHMFGALTLIAHFVALLTIDYRRALSRTYLTLIAWMVCLGLPLALAARHAGTGAITWISRPTLASIGAVALSFAGESPALLIVLGVSAAVATYYAWSRSTRRASVLLIACIVVPIGISFAVSQRRPVFIANYLIGAVPALILLSASSINVLQSRALQRCAGVAVLALTATGLPSYYMSEGAEAWRDAAAFVGQRSRISDAAVFIPFYVHAPFDYYGAQQPMSPSHHLRDKSVEPYDRVWLIESPRHVLLFRPALDSLRAELRKTHHLAETGHWSNVDVEFYVRP